MHRQVLHSGSMVGLYWPWWRGWSRGGGQAGRSRRRMEQSSGWSRRASAGMARPRPPVVGRAVSSASVRPLSASVRHCRASAAFFRRFFRRGRGAAHVQWRRAPSAARDRLPPLYVSTLIYVPYIKRVFRAPLWIFLCGRFTYAPRAVQQYSRQKCRRTNSRLLQKTHLWVHSFLAGHVFVCVDFLELSKYNALNLER